MDIVHLVRAFKKGVDKSLNHTTDAELSTQNDDLVNANKNLGNRVDYLTKGIQDGFISGVDDLEKIEQLEKDKQRLSDRIDVILKENEEVHLDKQSLMKQLDQEVRNDTQEGRIVPLVQENLSLSRQRDSWKEKAMNMMEKSSYDELTKVNAELRFQIEQVDRNQTVSKEAYDIAWDNNKALKKQVAHWKKLAEDNFISSVNDSETSDTWKNRYEKEVEKSDFWHRAYVERCTSSTGHNYVFSEIPNDCDGQQFTDSLKKYLNKDTYKMRVRGQYLKDEVKENGGWRKYERGQPIEQSKCLRVYLDKK